METPIQLATRIEEVFLNGKWIANTNFKLALEDVDFALSLKKVGDHNTIALLTFHINYYLNGVLNVLNGGPLEIRDKYSFDMPELKSEQDWITLKEDLFSNASKFSTRVNALSNQHLNDVFVKKEYGTYKRNIEAMLEHAYYHLGQIVLLKKLVAV